MDWENRLITFARKLVQTKSLSGQEEDVIALIKQEMKSLGYERVEIDAAGNVLGFLGSGPKLIHFDSHVDTVDVNDESEWTYPPYSGELADGALWGRGSVDMKGGLAASIYGAWLAAKENLLDGKTILVTGTVSEEVCDGVNLRLLYTQYDLWPDLFITCEPSDNRAVLGHKGKAQVRIHTQGLSAHGSDPDAGINAIYAMAPIIERVKALQESVSKKSGSVVLSQIESEAVSINAVPSSCAITLDRRISQSETLKEATTQFDQLIEGIDAYWEVGTLKERSWTGVGLLYRPMHAPWSIEEDHPLTKALLKAQKTVLGKELPFDFWDFSTNAVTPVEMEIPTIGLGPGNYKMAHCRDEHCPVEQYIQAAKIYKELIKEIK